MDIVTSDKIYSYVRSLNNPRIRYVKTDFIKDKPANSMQVTLRDWRDINDTFDLTKIEVLVTVHSDYSIDESELPILNLPNLRAWYCANKNVRHPKLHSIPLGITNKDEPKTRGLHKIIGNTERLACIAVEPKMSPPKNIAYLNVVFSNYPEEREEVKKLFANQEWVTTDIPNHTEEGHETFLRNIRNHRFVFAPRGNGLDTHRLWESLYLGAIPIVKKHVSMEDFVDLPILQVDTWSDVTPTLLETTYQNFEDNKENYNEVKNKWLDVNRLTFD